MIRWKCCIASLPLRAPRGDAKPDLALCPLPSASTEGLTTCSKQISWQNSSIKAHYSVL